MIYDANRKRFISKLHLPEIQWEKVSQILGHCEGDTYYISLRTSKFDISTRLVAIDKKSPITTPMYSDQLLAIDRRTGKLKWRRNISKRGFVRTPHFNLPFLISLTFLTDRSSRQTDWLLVELIDKRTGDTLTNQPPIRMDADLIRVDYDPQRRLVQLKSGHDHAVLGRQNIDIHFGQLFQSVDQN